MQTPLVEVEKLQLDHTEIFVVRDDLLPGGTKQRAALPYVLKLKSRGFTNLVYASPFSGFAQIALAHACKEAGLGCTIFAARDPSLLGLSPHEFTKLAAAHGAEIILSKDLEGSEMRSQHYTDENSGTMKIPLGFNDPVFNQLLRSELRIQWSVLCKKLKVEPKNIWVALGSGTMARALRFVLPEDIKLNVVDVHVLPEQDERIKGLSQMKNVFYHSVPQLFQEASHFTPPIPSNKYYDAKVWEKLVSLSGQGDVWWNIAR